MENQSLHGVFVCQHQPGPGEIITTNAQGWGAQDEEGAAIVAA